MIYILFYLLIQSFFTNAKLYLWSKHFITFSLENDFHNEKTVNEAIQEWNISSLELKQVLPSQGDIKIYFKNLIHDVIGFSQYPEKGIVTIARNNSNINITKIIQHEIAHSLGLQHSKNAKSLMYWGYTLNQQILDSDKRKLHELYKCRYDSAVLLNGYTYLKFKGRYYERIDLNTGFTTRGRIWHSSITRVISMYRNNSNYFILTDTKFFKFNRFMLFENDGFIRDLFPNISLKISAVLNFKNGSIICFLENKHAWYNDVFRNLNQEIFDTPIQGGYLDFKHIYLISRDNIFMYDENFRFLKRSRLCDNFKLKKLHCCNKFSNL